MTYAFMSIAGAPSADSSLLIAAARVWRQARDGGERVLPRLHALLATQGYGVLTPVLESLLRLCEAALRRPIRVGAEQSMSEDEALLLQLLACPNAVARTDCPDPLVVPLTTALHSTRIMMELARPR